MADAAVRGEAALVGGAVTADVTPSSGVPEAVIEVRALVVGAPLGRARDDTPAVHLVVARRALGVLGVDGAPPRGTLDGLHGAPRPLEPVLNGEGGGPREDLLEACPHGLGGGTLGLIAVPAVARLVHVPAAVVGGRQGVPSGGAGVPRALTDVAGLEVTDGVGARCTAAPRVDDVNVIMAGATPDVPLAAGPALDVVATGALVAALVQEVPGDLTSTAEVTAPQTGAREGAPPPVRPRGDRARRAVARPRDYWRKYFLFYSLFVMIPSILSLPAPSLVVAALAPTSEVQSGVAPPRVIRVPLRPSSPVLALLEAVPERLLVPECPPRRVSPLGVAEGVRAGARAVAADRGARVAPLDARPQEAILLRALGAVAAPSLRATRAADVATPRAETGADTAPGTTAGESRDLEGRAAAARPRAVTTLGVGEEAAAAAAVAEAAAGVGILTLAAALPSLIRAGGPC